VLGRPELIHDKRFATSPKRVANRGAMRDQLGIVFKTRTSEHWLAELRKVDVLCTRVADYADVAGHPQVAANAMITEMAHPIAGVVRVPGFPINSRESNALPHAAAPGLGEHSIEILEVYGYSAREIDELVAAGAVRVSGDDHAVVEAAA
jgi:crotonobetainyl-CoA:carnitine CoA-transferase CaiB-like acyl-CoA transferase